MAWRSLPAWEKVLLLITVRESQSPKEFFHVKFPFFRNLGPGTHVFFCRKQLALVLKNWRWGVFHCGHHDFWCGRRDQTGAVCNVPECFVGSQPYHLGGNFYNGMDGWDVLLTIFCCCKFEGWISSLVLFTIGDITQGIPSGIASFCTSSRLGIDAHRYAPAIAYGVSQRFPVHLMFPFDVAELTCHFEGMYPRIAKDKAQSDDPFREFLLEMDACRDQISLTWPTEKNWNCTIYFWLLTPFSWIGTRDLDFAHSTETQLKIFCRWTNQTFWATIFLCWIWIWPISYLKICTWIAFFIIFSHVFYLVSYEL